MMDLLQFNDTVEGGKLISFQLDKKTEQRIFNLCKKTGINKSGIIRILIRMSLATVEKE
jgi:predicted DNA-binding protein